MQLLRAGLLVPAQCGAKDRIVVNYALSHSPCVTGKDAAGKAVAVIDGVGENVRELKETGVASTLLWVTDSTPADFSHDGDAATRKIGVHPPANGTIFRVVEFAAAKDVHADYETGSASSSGYAVIVSGEIDMLLEDSEVHLKAGVVVV